MAKNAEHQSNTTPLYQESITVCYNDLDFSISGILSPYKDEKLEKLLIIKMEK